MVANKTVVSPIGSILEQCRRAFLIVFALTILTDTLSIAPLMYTMNVFDRVMSSRSGVTLVSLTTIILGVYIFWSAMDWLRSRLMVRISLRIDWDLAAKVFEASFRRQFNPKGVNVHQVLGDLLQLRQFLTGQSVLSLMDAPFAIVFIIIGGLFHPYLAIFAFVSSVLMVIVAYFNSKITAPILKAANDANAEASKVAANSLRQAESTLALGMLKPIRTRWYQHHREFLQLQVNATEATGLMGGVSGFLAKAMPSLQMALAAFLAMQNLITGGMVMVASMLISKSVGPIQKLIANWKDITAARQAFDRLNELLSSLDGEEQHMKLDPPEGFLTVKEAAAVPPGMQKPVIQGVSFSVSPGNALAIVGPSASGKTSLVRLLVGIWHPAMGSVRLDGVELSDWDHGEVGPYIGYVPQEIEFYEGTVAENIARLGPIDAEKVVMATKLLGIHEAILALPQGYDTILGPGGAVLSGGQKQRLAIARALYGLPKYVVMDEPNANLDEAGEVELMNAIDYLRRLGSTVIFTTHRPRLVKVADSVLVLRDGTQVAYGGRDALLQSVRKMATEESEDDDSDDPRLPPAVSAHIVA